MHQLKLSAFILTCIVLWVSSYVGSYNEGALAIASGPRVSSHSKESSITLPSNGHLIGLKDYTSNSPETDNRIGEHFGVNPASLHPKLQTQLSGSYSVERAGYHVRMLRKILFPYHFFW